MRGVLICCLAVLCGVANAKFPFEDVTLSWDKRVDDLVQRLTIEEVVNISVAQYGKSTIPVDRLGVKPYQFINECITGVRWENSTAFPQAIGLGASFSPDLAFNMSQAIARELRGFYNTEVKSQIYGHRGVNCFTPVINIMRHPLWGRNQETYGEDPWLSGQLSVGFVKGLQGDHPRYIQASGGCKHFDVHNGPENIPVSRFGFDAKVSERDWRMTFLPQFKTCVEAGSINIMCSYNRINGVPACANKKLLTDILRKEWGFNGYVISDSGAIENIVYHHKYTKTLAEAAADSVKAGCNVELTGATGSGVAYFNLLNAVKQNLISEEELRENLKKPMYSRMRQGEFDPVDMNPFTKIDMSVVLSQEHQDLAVKASAMSFVLMKNLNRVLPLKKRFDRLAIIGPFADNAETLFGDYIPNWDPKFVSTPYEGLKSLGDDVRYASGCDDPSCTNYDPKAIEKAVKGAQFVFVCLGVGSNLEREGHDRADLDLPGYQLQILKDAEFFSREAPLVLVLFNAGPVDLTWPKLSPEVDGIIECFYPAMGTGKALYQVVTATGDDGVPAARLPSTWPAQLHQVPSITDYNMTGHTYRYFDGGDPLYPFGYGLSYTSFHYQTVSVSPTSVRAGGNVTVTVQVLNRGPYNADEVTQVYMSWMEATVPVPRWTLVGFKRHRHTVNQSSSLSFVVSAEQMAVWVDEATGFQVQPGKMLIYAGGQQPYQRTDTDTNVIGTSFLVTA
ncbi:hypothetical protein CAPTEDRAFT_228276 [Capitella teleta]|uniref:Fibronectin type III-like domain-containing protein n=2 Tax=Capitella teleta TaxID=283909 RepID=R7UZ23_CAPTE|nr:hypothetical protein CAPTEDRAFT_228276 [Capitella teleta]|eukprot:ELU08656.1 hypothetical protein CAPTEDRAFT_228276 [Capitella teleta]